MSDPFPGTPPPLPPPGPPPSPGQPSAAASPRPPGIVPGPPVIGPAPSPGRPVPPLYAPQSPVGPPPVSPPRPGGGRGAGGRSGARGLWIAAVVGVGLVTGTCGVALGAAGDDETGEGATADGAETVTVPTTRTQTRTTTTTVVASPEPPPEPEGPRNEFEDGTWLVNLDIAPGQYRSEPDDDRRGGCYYARLAGTEGGLDQIIANQYIDAGQQAVVTILETDEAFESSGCGRWVTVE